MNIEEIKKRKQELGWTNADLSKRSGVPLGTVQKALGGTTKCPRRETLKKLTAALLAGKEEELADSDSFRLNESQAVYAIPGSPKKQGEYTLEDYYAIPDDRRVELIDGVIYDFATPRISHQLIIGEVYSQIRRYLDEHPDGSCLPILSPMDVQLDCDDRTMVEPDLLIVCDFDKLMKRNIYGAPSFVMEVLSPSTRRRDLIIKLNKYMNAGVKEYWIVDSEKETVTAYDFTDDDFPEVYTFNDDVPLAVSGNRCRVDFSQIKKYLTMLEK